MSCNCAECYRAACERRSVGFGLTAQTTSESSGAIGTVAGAALSFVPGGSLISSLITNIGSLFGAAPRGNLQKFQRTAYPYMRTLAARSRIPVFIYWFGEAVGVNPDGSYGVVYAYGNAENYEMKLVQEGAVPFYAATCPAPATDCVNNPSQLGFQLYDPNNSAPTLQDTVLNVTPDTTSGGSVTRLPDGTLTTLQTADMGLLPGGISMQNVLLFAGVGLAAFLIFGGDSKGKGA